MLNLPPAQLMQTDAAFANLKAFGNSLKPSDASDAKAQLVFSDHLRVGRYNSHELRPSEDWLLQQ